MAGVATARFPMMNRILRWDSYEMEGSVEPAMSLSDTIFGFLEEQGSVLSDSTDNSLEGFEDDEEEKDNLESDKGFWESQNQQLQAIICRTSSLESKIRKATKEALRELQLSGNNVCSCGCPLSGGCRMCKMREICGRLQNLGYNSAICKSKWKSSPEIPSGEHTFLDVIDNSNPKKGEVRVIIELDFRGGFEIARASQEYNQLVSMLPEVFVGKVERLLNITKILSTGAKKCMKEKKMHLGPWRKQKYMQAKWLKVSERMAAPTPLSTSYSGRKSRPRASMLTVDLLENLHCTAVEVL